ncbi:hypothetical protein AB0D97_27885 [Streptomyces roseus]|uniref:hypothetical protein n=1 Tax=Streptomyces roseus TaxID=66430 RepID=UPI0033EC51BC
MRLAVPAERAWSPTGRRQQADAAMTMPVRGSALAGPALTALLAAFPDLGALLLGIGLLRLVAALVPGKGAVAATPVTAAPADVPVPAAGPAPCAGFRTEFLEGVRKARRHPWFLAGLAAAGHATSRPARPVRPSGRGRV